MGDKLLVDTAASLPKRKGRKEAVKSPAQSTKPVPKGKTTRKPQTAAQRAASLANLAKARAARGV